MAAQAREDRRPLVAVIHKKDGTREYFAVKELGNPRYFHCKYGVFMINEQYIKKARPYWEIHYRVDDCEPIERMGSV